MRIYVLLAVLALASLLLGISVGRSELGVSSSAMILELRAARTGVGFLVGASLSVAGVLVQGLFRNPLASPSVLGTTAGASLGGQTALLVGALILGGMPGFLHPEMFLAFGCVTGALLSLVILLMIHRVHRDLIVILLSGFVLSSLFLSVGSFLTSMAQAWWELGRALVTFSLGDISGVGQRQLWLILPLTLIGTGFALSWARPLDLLLSGEDEARALGLDTSPVRVWVIVWTAMLTAGAVAVGGNIGFVGLVVPHALRPFVGVTHRRLIPAAVLGGGAFVVVCDTVARVISPRSEVPLGVVTGMVGAPVFLWLLIRHHRRLRDE